MRRALTLLALPIAAGCLLHHAADAQPYAPPGYYAAPPPTYYAAPPPPGYYPPPPPPGYYAPQPPPATYYAPVQPPPPPAYAQGVGPAYSPENCGTPDEPKPCPPMPRVPLQYYPANR